MDKTYSELLRDPRWQRKRLEILQRDNFSCQECGCTNNILMVHHKHYRRGLKPWEYDNKDLITLCEKCHKNKHENIINTKNCTVRYKRIPIPSLSKSYIWIKGSKKEKAFLHIDDTKITFSKHNLEEFSEIISELINSL